MSGKQVFFVVLATRVVCWQTLKLGGERNSQFRRSQTSLIRVEKLSQASLSGRRKRSESGGSWPGIALHMAGLGGWPIQLVDMGTIQAVWLIGYRHHSG